MTVILEYPFLNSLSIISTSQSQILLFKFFYRAVYFKMSQFITSSAMIMRVLSMSVITLVAGLATFSFGGLVRTKGSNIFFLIISIANIFRATFKEIVCLFINLTRFIGTRISIQQLNLLSLIIINFRDFFQFKRIRLLWYQVFLII